MTWPIKRMALRVFAALPLPDEIADTACQEMKGVPGAKWRPRENLHITLCFYGSLLEPDVIELDSALGQIHCPPFELRLKSAGRFGGEEPSALWLGVSHSTSLRDLARQCRKAARSARIDIEKRTFSPHVTLAYLKKETDPGKLQRFEQRLGLFESKPFWVDRFHLYSSWDRKPGTPNFYQIETEYPLND